MELGSWLEEEVTGRYALGGYMVLNFFNIYLLVVFF